MSDLKTKYEPKIKAIEENDSMTNAEKVEAFAKLAMDIFNELHGEIRHAHENIQISDSMTSRITRANGSVEQREV